MQTGRRILSVFGPISWSAALLCGAIAALAWPADVAAQEAPDELLQAWRRRQELLKTARFTFASDGEERWGEGTQFDSYRLPHVFVMSDKKWRHESQSLDGRKIVSTFDGRQGMRMFGGTQVSILRDPLNIDVRHRQLQPLVHWFRPLDGRFHGGVDLADSELVSANEFVEGRRCIRLRAPPEQPGSPLQLFLDVDPARDYVVVRCVSEVEERPVTQIDISYAEDPKVGWVPTAWESVCWLETGAVSSRYSSTVENYTLNEKQSEKMFVIDFPPGAMVFDEAVGLTFRIDDDWEKHVVPPPKRPAAKKPAYRPPSVSQMKNAKSWNERMARGTLFVAIGALIALGVAALVKIRRRSAGSIVCTTASAARRIPGPLQFGLCPRVTL